MEIGSKGLANADLIIPQETTLIFRVVQKDEEGNVIDHSGSICHMAFQSKDKSQTWDMSNCCSPRADYIGVEIPPTATEDMPTGKVLWDLIVTTAAGENIRMLYGSAQIVDTYALDGD